MVRHKNRYMVVQINPMEKQDTEPLKLRGPALHDAIFEKVQQIHGDFGVAAIRAGFTAKYCNENTRIAIVRARRGPHKLVASCLPCIKIVGKERVKVETLYVGASIRHCFIFIKGYQEKKFNEYCVGLRTDEEKSKLKETMLNLDPVLAIL